MAINLRPLADRVVVEPQEREDTFAGGQLILPETAQEKPQQGTVLSAGPGSRDKDGKHIEMDVKAGDTVLYGKYAGTEIKVNGTKVLILKESDILAIVDN